ncbi:hypothetical protein [Streptomyces sp. RK75]|uniref:hypothetical protein n=1 Tax=Streptomyces sp. RK75 TaxID=2824895 RepID=UPI001FFC9569|nr:hypothetical protein [Streptomyces sp. RK75]
MTHDSIRITPLAERPELTGRLYDIAEDWPAFIAHDQVAAALLQRVPEDFPHHCVVATDGDRVPRWARSTVISSALATVAG